MTPPASGNDPMMFPGGGRLAFDFGFPHVISNYPDGIGTGGEKEVFLWVSTMPIDPVSIAFLD